jgi:hypothetical protein
MGAAVSELAAALTELEELLRCCGEDARADWVARRRAAPVRSEIRAALAGMGSLSDIPLVPRRCDLSAAEVERRREALLRRLDRLTSEEAPPAGPPRMIPVGSSSRDLPPR